MRRTGRVVAALVATLVVLVALGGTAASQQGGDDTLLVRSVDGRDREAVEVRFLYSGPRETVPDLVIRENGTIVSNSTPVQVDETEQFGIVLAIDTSASMRENSAFERATAAAAEFVRNKDADDQIAIVSFNDQVEVVQQFTADEDALLAGVDRLGLSGGTSLFDAVQRSVNLFDGTDLVPNIVLVTDGRDTASTTTDGVASSLLAESNTLLFAIGIQSGDLDIGALDRLTAPTGGTVLSSADPAELTELYADVQGRLRRQFRATFVSQTEASGPIDLQLTIGNTTTEASFTPGSELNSALQVEPVVRAERGGVGALQSGAFLWVAIALVLVAVAFAVFAIGSAIATDRRSLDTALQPYSDGFVAPDDDDDRMATSAILQRAVELTGDFADRRGFLVRVEDMLERANLPLRAAEALFFWLVASAVLAVIGGLLAGNAVAGLLILALAIALPPVIVNYLSRRRQKQFNEQLPDMLGLLASTLRAGYSLMQGVEAAAQEVSEPIRKELKRVVTEARLGMPIEQAFDGVATRMGSRDFEWATMAIGIQREVGGNLAELLDTVAETMTERERLRRDISSLTAEGRISALVLGLLPIVVGIMIFTISPDYMEALYTETVGIIMLVGSAILMGFGFLWMYKIIDIEV